MGFGDGHLAQLLALNCGSNHCLQLRQAAQKEAARSVPMVGLLEKAGLKLQAGGRRTVGTSQ